MSTTVSEWNEDARAMTMCVGTVFIAASPLPHPARPWHKQRRRSAPRRSIRTEAQEKATAVRTTIDEKVDRGEICTLVQRFYAAEGTVVEFLEDNKSS